ncbi:DUF262 domain-containing protein [Actinoplanes sp. NPDC026670]|uniref:DUF262 domain-containing protein n=1 Tax=Actinoplanes sp. NPDC026670 TaxID=3154700 RepID=UPI0033E117C0
MANAVNAPHSLSIADALRMIEQGRFRIPSFQRPFTWSVRQTIAFFESIVTGLPTGALVVLENAAEPEEVQIGFTTVRAPADPFAWWIVDGSQRLGALASVLLTGNSRKGSIRLAYDLETGDLIERRQDSAQTHQLPLDVVANQVSFWQWVNDQGAYLGHYIDRAVDVRARIMDYQLTLVRMLGAGAETAADVFVRLNSTAVSLTRTDLFHARHPGSQADSGSTLRASSRRLSTLGTGRVPAEAILDVMLALGEATEPAELLAEGNTRLLTDAEPAIARSIAWLRDEAAIPHLSVWQSHLNLLPAIARFFHLNPAASTRSRILLRRWLWRTMSRPSEQVQGYIRSAVRGNDSMDAFRLLQHVSTKKPERTVLRHVGHPLALTILEPRSLANGQAIDVTTVLERFGKSAFRRLGGVSILSPHDEGPLEERVLAAVDDPDLLAGHALTSTIARGLASAEPIGFRQARKDLLAEYASTAIARWAEWGASDRPAISDLLVDDDLVVDDETREDMDL